MSITQSIVYNFSSTNRTSLPKFQTLFFNPISYKSPCSTNRSLQYSIWQNSSKLKRNFVVYSSIPSEVPPPNSSGGRLPGGIPGSWKGWLLGIVVSVIIPLLTNKWGALLKWSERIEATIQTVENMVEEVEEVAEKVDKFTEHIRADLPEGELKTALGRIEDVAEKVAKDAKQIDTMIDKVQEAEDKLQVLIEKEEERSAAAKKEKTETKLSK